ncbi:MAG: glycosyltransferase family 2 protein [Candidatus Coatesbacteria bacterium]|nr:glycosyltransferase family 2 protein [Candidatus Coatesbacteria bacterium]
MFKSNLVSVVIPCFNEEKGIQDTILQIKELGDIIDEILVVDNNSTDNTGKVAEELGARVVFEKIPGYGRAYKTGLAAAKGYYIATLDGDATYPADKIPYLLEVLHNENLDFISACRKPTDWHFNIESILRLAGNRVLTTTLWILFFCYLVDSQSGMWVFKHDILHLFDLTSDGMPFSEELKIEAFRKKELKVKEVPIIFRYHDRQGPSKLNLWKDGMMNLQFLFKKRLGLINKNEIADFRRS